MTAEDDEFVFLLEKVRALPPMTAEQRIEQALNFAWGNVALSWGDPPKMSRDRFRADGWREEWRKLRAALEKIAAGDETVARAIADEALK